MVLWIQIMIKILRLDGIWIISEIEEIGGVELGDPDCKLISPMEMKAKTLQHYPPHSKKEDIAVRSTDIFVVAEPTDEILKLYNDKK